MESRIPETIRKSPEVFKTIIKVEHLPLYEQAAEKTGYGMRVTARAGEAILIEDRERRTQQRMGTPLTVEVSPGFLEVAVTVPIGQEKRGTSSFYAVVKELEQSSK